MRYTNLVRVLAIRFSPIFLRERDVAQWRGSSFFEVLIVLLEASPLVRFLASQGTRERSVVGAFAPVHGHSLVPDLKYAGRVGRQAQAMANDVSVDVQTPVLTSVSVSGVNAGDEGSYR